MSENLVRGEHILNHIFLPIHMAQELSTQQVFAFLPLRSYGFRFIVQGDFDLPSSREDVNTDSAWNQWLREEIPSVFLEAAAKMKVQITCLVHFDTVYAFLVPLLSAVGQNTGLKFAFFIGQLSTFSKKGGLKHVVHYDYFHFEEQ